MKFFMCIFSVLVSTILQLYFSWFSWKSQRMTLLLTHSVSKLFPLMSSFYRCSFNEWNDYYVMSASNVATWDKIPRFKPQWNQWKSFFWLQYPLVQRVFLLCNSACSFQPNVGKLEKCDSSDKMCIHSKSFHCYGLQWTPLCQCYGK